MDEAQNQNITPPVSSPAPMPSPQPAPGTSSSPEQQINISNSAVMAVLAYLGILILVPILVSKNDPFVKFHIKQGIGLIILWLIFWVLSFVGGVFLAITRLPFLTLVFPLLWLLSVVLMVVGIINAATGKMKDLPIVGGWGNKFNF